jgi:hypothetical protein
VKRCTKLVIWKPKNWFWMQLQPCSRKIWISWCRSCANHHFLDQPNSWGNRIQSVTAHVTEFGFMLLPALAETRRANTDCLEALGKEQKTYEMHRELFLERFVTLVYLLWTLSIIWNIFKIYCRCWTVSSVTFL